MEERHFLAANPVAGWVLAVLIVVYGASSIPTGIAGGGWVAMSLGLLVIIAITSARLRVSTNGGQLHISFWPFWRRRIDFREIESVGLKPHRFRDVGGFGIRFARGAVVYACKGKQLVVISPVGKKMDVWFTTEKGEGWLQELQSHGVPIKLEQP